MWYSYASGSVTKNIHQPSHLYLYGRHSAFVLTNRLRLREIFTFFRMYILFVDIETMVCMILCYLYDVPSRKYRNEQYNIENFGVLMCLLSILIFFFFFFLGPFGVPLGLLAHLIKNSPVLLDWFLVF